MSPIENAAVIWDVATGAKKRELEALRGELSQQRRQIEEMTAKVAAMPDGPKRSAAWALRVKAQQAWQPVTRQFNDAVIAYNKISAVIKDKSEGTYDPGRINPSLSLLPIAWIAVAAASAVAAIYALSSLIDSIKSTKTEVRGYMDQFAGVLREGGGVVREGGGVIAQTTNLAFVVGAVVVAYMVFQYLPKRKAARAAA